MKEQPDFDQPDYEYLGKFLAAFHNESDRGAAMVAAAMLDDRLKAMLGAFFIDSKEGEDLLSGFNAPLGTFAARASAAMALGLLERGEYRKITIIRKIRNEFAHGWDSISFKTDKVAALAMELPWRAPAEFDKAGTKPRNRFDAAVAVLQLDLMWRAQLVERERRSERVWPNKARDFRRARAEKLAGTRSASTPKRPAKRA